MKKNITIITVISVWEYFRKV